MSEITVFHVYPNCRKIIISFLLACICLRVAQKVIGLIQSPAAIQYQYHWIRFSLNIVILVKSSPALFTRIAFLCFRLFAVKTCCCFFFSLWLLVTVLFPPLSIFIWNELVRLSRSSQPVKREDEKKFFIALLQYNYQLRLKSYLLGRHLLVIFDFFCLFVCSCFHYQCFLAIFTFCAFLGLMETQLISGLFTGPKTAKIKALILD